MVSKTLKRRIDFGHNEAMKNNIHLKEFKTLVNEISNFSIDNKLIQSCAYETEDLLEIVSQYDFLLLSFDTTLVKLRDTFEINKPILHNNMMISLGLFNIFRAMYHDLIIIRNCLNSRLEIQMNTVTRAFIEKSRILLLCAIDKDYSTELILNAKKLDSFNRYNQYYKPSKVKNNIRRAINQNKSLDSLSYCINHNMSLSYSYLSEFVHCDIFSILNSSFNSERGFNISEKLNESMRFKIMAERFLEFTLLVYTDFVKLTGEDLKTYSPYWNEIHAYYLGFISEMYETES